MKRLGVTLLAAVCVGALLAGCRTPIVQAACDGTITASNAGTLTDPALVEVSGLVASAKNPGTLWIHNDSGDAARVFAISDAGTTRVTYSLAGATAVDWEDIALGAGPIAGQSYLYVGDIGDNNAVRPNVVVYRVAEPVVSGTGTQTLSGVDKLTFTYPDGARNAEALMVDPRSGDLIVIEKSITGGPVGVYRAPANLAAGSTTVLTRIATLTLPAGLASSVTAGDISADGNSIAVRTYGAVHLWSRLGDQTLIGVLETAPCDGPLPAELQGEAIGFRPAGDSYFTVSEGTAPVLHRFNLPPKPPTP